MGCLPGIHEPLGGRGRGGGGEAEGRIFCESGVVVRTCNPSTREAEADDFFEFEASLRSTVL